MSKVTSRIFVAVQQLLPKRLITALVFHVARVRHKGLKNFFIRCFVKAYDVEVEEASLPVPEGYTTFNEFFVRELKVGARSIDSNITSIVSPVDGSVSAAGKISTDSIFQAKNLQFTLADLLATDTDDTESFRDGSFATLYLAPHNYHRVHAPMRGRVVAARYIPGDLFSVNEATVSLLPMLFARNERLICHCITESGPMALILVGALNVGSISTRWTGEIRPRSKGIVEQFDLQRSQQSASFDKGEQIGWFNMGSTVIILLPQDNHELLPTILPGTKLKMGQLIGHTSKLDS